MLQIIKLTHAPFLQADDQGKVQPLHRVAIATKGAGVFIIDINLLTYETNRDEHVYL